MTGWSEFLEDMEERVRGAERTLTSGGPAPTAFCRPAGLGPLPPALADRARAVFAASLEVQRRLQDAVGVMASRQPLTAPRSAPTALYVDERA